MHRDIPAEAERIILDAATAQRAYAVLIRNAAENPRLRLAMIDARVMADQEARGESRVPPPPPNIMEPIAVAVDRELERMRPDAEWRVVQWRAMRRLGGCGYVQLSLSYRAEMRRKLRRFIKDSGLTIAEFAELSGQDETTLHDHLGSGKIPKTRAAWYRRIVSLEVKKGAVIMTIRRTPRGPQSRRD